MKKKVLKSIFNPFAFFLFSIFFLLPALVFAEHRNGKGIFVDYSGPESIERLELEWEKINVAKKEIEVEKGKLEMEKEKLKLERQKLNTFKKEKSNNVPEAPESYDPTEDDPWGALC